VDVAAIIPTYNEAQNLPSLVSALLDLDLLAHVVIVDDNSPDGTGEIADALSRQRPQVRVIHRSAKLGLGTAYLAGFETAIDLGSDAVLTMDADFSHHPRFVPAVLASAAEYDLVIGSRYVPEGGTSNWSLARRGLSHTANLVARHVLGLPVRDCTAGFRCYRREILQRVELASIRSSGYSFLVEMLFKCHRAGFRIAEVPILFEDRFQGASKISRDEILKAILTVLRLAREPRPDQSRPV
jgi:glycosyltransferase involved in cell wall biosynthesis